MEQAEAVKTKMVESYFGQKPITRDQFITQWKDHFSQVFHLTETTAQFDELKVMQARLAELAGAKWDKLK